MSINRWLGLGLGTVVLAGCSSIAPAAPVATGAPSSSPATSASSTTACSDASIDAAKQALRDVGSYAYEAEGYIDRWEQFTGSEGPLETPDTSVRQPTKFSGAYVAPDRQTEERHLVTRDDVVEARRTIGDDVWLRFVGSKRWQQTDVTPAPANPILAIVDQPLDWAIDDSDVPSGHCRYLGTSAVGLWTVRMTVPEGSTMPASVELTQRIDNPPEWGEAFVQTDVYALQSDAEVTIDPPPTDTGPATAADVLYYLERRGCLEPPCDVSGFAPVYEAHNDTVDLFGYHLPSGNGYVWFDDGQPSKAGGQACPSDWVVAFHAGGQAGDTQWIGGPLTAVDTATMHVRLTDGEESEHTISAPGFIVPGGIVDGPELESLWIVGPDGDELFRYDEPSPETGVPPPPPPSPGC